MGFIGDMFKPAESALGQVATTGLSAIPYLPGFSSGGGGGGGQQSPGYNLADIIPMLNNAHAQAAWSPFAAALARLHPNQQGYAGLGMPNPARAVEQGGQNFANMAQGAANSITRPTLPTPPRPVLPTPPRPANPAPPAMMGQWGGGWGSGPLGRSWETSSNPAQGWQASPQQTPQQLGGQSSGWSKTSSDPQGDQWTRR